MPPLKASPKSPLSMTSKVPWKSTARCVIAGASQRRVCNRRFSTTCAFNGFGVKIPHHNLVRTRSQLRLAQCFVENRKALESIVGRALAKQIKVPA